MRQFTLRVAEMATFGGQIHVRCAGGPAPESAPGQGWLALADVPAQPFLRLPLFPFPGEAGCWEFLLPPGHPFAGLEPGSALDLLGPFGRGFNYPPRASHLLVVANALDRVYPIIHAALARRFMVALLTSEAGAMHVSPLHTDLPLAIEIHHGPLSTDLATWADIMAADVPDANALVRTARELRPGQPRGFVQAFVIPPMPCGTGACQACWVEFGHGRALACLEGPVFQL